MMLLNNAIIEEIQKVSEISSYLWQREWAERNGGNISLNLTGMQEPSEIEKKTARYLPYNMPPEAANMLLFCTGAGSRLREMKDKPEVAACIFAIDEKAKGYHILWGGANDPGFQPTSEFITHLLIHISNNHHGKKDRCVLHTHPIELIALSHHPRFGNDEKVLNQALWSMLPEIRIFVPKGIGIVPYALPGSAELAKLTIEGLKDYSVILWSKHGVLATGKDALETFDLIDVTNKGAKIYLSCLKAGFTPEGLSDEQIKGLEVFL